ncbi:DMT family transporter [Weissella cibaria]|uniref:DMT family transporter n=1 Tax=Weissella cibaria TaxID=137591 RepID=UPI000BFFA11C|nr:multidrug efflux SMR transporter [Weissella cibaria]
MAYVYLAIAIIGELIGTNLLRYSDGFTKLVPTVSSLTAYVIAFCFLAQGLKLGLPVNIAYAIWSGLGIVLISLVMVVIFHQSINWPTIVGLVLIVIGVVIVNLFGVEH